ncbi:hypothetical protein WJX81_003926 [Elliptochloris bilobata]|uniref:Uncharacterized protein n=1 Tax=Elliptochloris bilobata TaxID=381761 RepID=A0AAW1RH37_9CHLO
MATQQKEQVQAEHSPKQIGERTTATKPFRPPATTAALLDADVAKAFDRQKQVGRAVREARAASQALARRAAAWSASLLADLAALLGSLRPAVMLDYVVVPAGVVAALAHEVTASTGQQLLVGEWCGCCYLLRAELVLARGKAALHVPRLVSFNVADGGRSATCRWATPDETAGFCARLLPVAAAVQAASNAGVILKLDAVAGAPCMPSLNGWLLGYPVVYLVDEGNVDAAAKCLSDTPLLLVKALAPDSPGGCGVEPAVLASFTHQ